MVVATRYYAAARAAAGADGDTFEFPENATLGLLIAVLTERYGDELGRLLPRCTFSLDGTLVRERSASLTPGSTVDILPPFAGG